jgi:predicted Zn-dependent protease
VAVLPAHCPNAYDANYGATGWAGTESLVYDSNSGLIYEGTAWMKFNDYYAYTSSELQQNTCHEIGHVLGLDHNFYKTSCLYYAITTDSSRTLPLATTHCSQ